MHGGTKIKKKKIGKEREKIDMEFLSKSQLNVIVL